MTSEVRSFFRGGLVLVALLLSTTVLLADEVVLQNGSRLIGKVVRMQDGTLHFEPDGASAIEIEYAQVRSLTTADGTVFVLEDGSELVGRADVKRKELVIASESLGEQPLELGQVAAINPKPEKVATRGNVTLSGSLKDGNTREKDAHFEADLEILFRKRRLSLRSAWDYAEEEGVRTERNTSIFGKFDWFLDDRTFVYANGAAEGDEFEDLNLRTTIGGGVGYQAIREDDLELYVETGISYVNDDFDGITDDDRIASRTSLRVDWEVIPEEVTVYHFLETFWGFEDEGDINVITSTGVRVSIWEGFYASFQIDFEWDNMPMASETRKDTTYTLGIGYAFDH